MTNRIRALVAAMCLGLPVLACSGGEGATGPTASLMAKVSGDEQAGLPGATLPQPLEVRVTDAAGNAVPGVSVTFAPSSGTVNPQTMDTDAQGRARTTLTLPNQGANVTVAAVAAGVPPVTFTARSVSNPIILTTTFLPAARQGLAYTRKMAATGGTGGAVTFTATGALPPGLTLASDGTISGTPTQAGAFPITLRANEAGAQEATLQVTMNVCAPPAAMTVGEVRVSDPVGRGACGIFLPSGAANQRYRVGVVRTSNDTASSNVSTLTVLVRGSGVTGALASPALATASEPEDFAAPAIGDDVTRLVRSWQQSKPAHMRHLMDDAELVQMLGSRGLLPAQPPLRASAASLPETLQIDPHATGTCTTTNRVTAVRIAEDDRMAVYQDAAQNANAATSVSAAAAQRLLNMYRDYGKVIIDSYFGGLPDMDTNGKVIVFVTPAVTNDLLGRVNVGDFYNRQTCASSNEGEYVYMNYQVVRPLADAGLQLGFYAVTHELKHVSSFSQRFRRAGTATPVFHPTWLEEGSAEIAGERIARHAWAVMGGPSVSTTVNANHFFARDSTRADVTTENLGVLWMLLGVQGYLAQQPNSVVSLVDPLTSDIYASGWTFLRWLGDAYGGASSAPRADSVFFKRLNDQGTASGLPGLESVVGRTWAQLMEEYTAAAMVNARLVIPRGFTSYDFITSIEIFCFAVDPVDFPESQCEPPPGAPGAFPWPVTTDSQGLSEVRSFADAEFAGPIGPSGLRVHDLVSNGSGSGTEVSVEITAPARVVLVRLR